MTTEVIVNLLVEGGGVAILAFMWWTERTDRKTAEAKLLTSHEKTADVFKTMFEKAQA